jgi:GTP-binding protein Era
MTTRCGTVALVGRPNTGKSSLLNAILGTRLSMVSPKAQATRLPVTGLHTTAEAQLILLDLPGLLDPAYALQRSLRHLALEGLQRADLIVHLHPAPEAPAPDLVTLLPDVEPAVTTHVLVVYTKADLVSPAVREELAVAGSAVVSVDDPASIAGLVDRIAALLPVGPFRHDPEDIGTQPVRFFVGEYLREAAFELLEEEVPYAVTVEVEEFREERRPVYIRATLYVERESQKGIVIGKGAAMLKQLGTHARGRLEALLGESVYLDTRVKVLPNWRRRAATLARFGFPLPPDETS